MQAVATPDSPGDSSQTPLPTGLQGDLELELIGLANALYNLGTTVVNDLSKERQAQQQITAPGAAVPPPPTKPVGQRVNDVIGHLSNVEEMADGLDTMIPMQILQDIDNSRNPMSSTKDRLERAATENQFMNGKIKAIESYRSTLNKALTEHFPDIAPYLEESEDGSATPESGMSSNSTAENRPSFIPNIKTEA